MPNIRMTRRRFALATTAAALAGHSVRVRAQHKGPWLADMHSHYGQFLPRLFGLDLVRHMSDTGTTLLAWAVTDDHRWISLTQRGWRQHREPAPGELWDSFQKRLPGYEAKLAGWNVTKALTQADVDAALVGAPRVLLATEAANFLEGQPERVAEAHALGIRHMQMVHFIQSPLGDHQTAEPRHGGLTPTGAKVVAECRRWGIVVDLAHSTPSFVDGAADASGAAMVWSHSWIVRSYADEIMRMCDLLGTGHVAFGTDMGRARARARSFLAAAGESERAIDRCGQN